MYEFDYDPTDIKRFDGYRFQTRNAVYELQGRKLSRNAKHVGRVKLLAGIDHKAWDEVFHLMYAGQRPSIETLIRDKGREPAPGLHLIAFLTNDCKATSVIQRVLPAGTPIAEPAPEE